MVFVADAVSQLVLPPFFVAHEHVPVRR